MPKPLKSQGNGNGLRATTQGLRPSDFPLGSPESRAAARAMLQSHVELTDYDRDCLLVYCANIYSPNYNDVAETEFYKRGLEVREIVHGPIILAFEDLLHRVWEKNRDSCSTAFSLYLSLHKGVPKRGDILQYEVIQRVFNPKVVERSIKEVREAWARRLPELPCPVKFEGGKVWRRFAESKRKQEVWWQVEKEVDWQIWGHIEAEAEGTRLFCSYLCAVCWAMEPCPPAIRSVFFCEDDEGKFHIKPADCFTSKNEVSK